MATAVSHHPYFKHPYNPRQAAANRHRQAAAKRDRPSSSRLAPTVDWVLVDRRVAVLDPLFPNLLSHPSFPSAATEDGFEVRLYLASPPAISLGLLLDGAPPLRHGLRKPTILAADAGRILLRVPVPPEVNLLTFTAGAVSSLVAIPPRAEMDIANLSLTRGTGFVSNGDDYTVAFLQTWVTWSGNTQQETARISIYSSSSDSWKTISLDMPWSRPPPGIQWTAWRLDAAVSFRDCVSWADFSLGLITCDVLNEEPTLYFMLLPIVTARTAQSWMHTSLCVSEEQLRFLSIGRGPGPQDATIRVWTLDMDGYCWREDRGLVLSSGISLPKGVLLSGSDSNIMYFLLQQGPVKFVYSVDRHELSVLERYPYVEDVSRGPAFDTPFVGSDVSLFVHDPPVLPAGPGDDNDGGLNLQALVPTAGRTKARKTD